MKDLIIVANWKENKTAPSAVEWLSAIVNNQLSTVNKRVIVCPPFTLIQTVSDFIKSNNLPIEVGVQDISKFDEGAHTGEVSAREASEFARFSIIGHSERRVLGETDDDIKEKVGIAMKFNIEPIVCVVNENVPIPSNARTVAYEPVEAIGTGNPDTPENAQKIASIIKDKNRQVSKVLYGGSVTNDNVRKFTEMESIDGVLVGGASLDANEFSSIIKNA